MMKFKDMESIVGLMVELIQEDGIKIKCKGMEKQLGLMEEFMKDHMIKI